MNHDETLSDCSQTLEVLEAVALGGLPASDRLAIDARAHHAGCLHCQQAWQTRRLWGERLAAAMVDVPVPTATAWLSRAAEPPRRPARWWLVAAALVLLLSVGFGTWMMQPLALGAAIDRQTIALHIADDLASFPSHAGTFEPRLPVTWRSAFAQAPALVRGFPAGNPRGAALISYQLALRHGSDSIRGRLLIMPRTLFVDPPAGEDFATAEVFYARDGGVWCAWSEGTLVYVCYVRSGIHDLQRLQQALDRPRSLT